MDHSLGWSPTSKVLGLKISCRKQTFHSVTVENKLLLLLSHIILSSGFQVPFCTQILFGWMNGLKVVGKTSNLEVVILKAEKGELLKVSMIN